MSQPFVTAVCVTGKEPERVKKFLDVAIRCFLNQSYPDAQRELLLVADGCFDLLPQAPVPPIRIVAVQSPRSLGELRNIGLEKARGDLIIQWDDDDYYREDRMAAQVAVWQQNPNVPVLLNYQLCYDWGSDTAALRFFDHTAIHGSILHPKTDARYPAQGKEEDTLFLGNWQAVSVMQNDPRMYVRFAHPSSTWDADHTLRHFAQPWAKGGWWLSDEHRGYLRAVLGEYDRAAGRSPEVETFRRSRQCRDLHEALAAAGETKTAVPELIERG